MLAYITNNRCFSNVAVRVCKAAPCLYSSTAPSSLYFCSSSENGVEKRFSSEPLSFY